MEGIWIAKDEAGLGERAHDIFYAAEVDRHFSSDARINGGQERGGDLDERHPAAEHGGGEPAKVSDHASPQQENDWCRTGVGKLLEERGAAARKLVPVFACFTGWNAVGCDGVEPCVGE